MRANKFKIVFFLIFFLHYCNALSIDERYLMSTYDNYHQLNSIASLKIAADKYNINQFFLTSDKQCLPTSIAPPDHLLKNKYREQHTYNLHYQKDNFDYFIHKIDLNGDGICDWLREGAEQHRSDLGLADAKNFLFLGTSKGWRYSAQTIKGKELVKKSQTLGDFYYPDQFIGFAVPFVAFVYVKNKSKPYVVTYSTSEDRVPGVDLNQYRTFRWNDEIDNFELVPIPEHAAVMLFLQKEFCGKDPTKVIPGRDVSRFSTPAYGGTSLCEKVDKPKVIAPIKP